MTELNPNFCASQRVRTKICGITTLEDAYAAVCAGADALGFVFYPHSSRYVSEDQVRAITAELPPFVTRVGLFVNAPAAQIQRTMKFCALDVAQLHGDETPEQCCIEGVRVIKALRLKDHGALDSCEAYWRAGIEAFLVDAWVKDAYGGTGACAPWSLAAELAQKYSVILAGGLTPENVSAAIKQVAPFAVDVSSGVERCAGKKDADKMDAFVANALACAGS